MLRQRRADGPCRDHRRNRPCFLAWRTRARWRRASRGRCRRRPRRRAPRRAPSPTRAPAARGATAGSASPAPRRAASSRRRSTRAPRAARSADPRASPRRLRSSPSGRLVRPRLSIDRGRSSAGISFLLARFLPGASAPFFRVTRVGPSSVQTDGFRGDPPRAAPGISRTLGA